ncbi:helix-turn-helix domain-containing protein [Rouxiella sp. T17]|uniref:TetR/AcrR family transcriptional regulator n=1 Tax=Rouxiella sp. T17 TaxID=3085684 RepID=UPI002FC759A3
MNASSKISGTLPAGRGRPAVPEEELIDKIHNAAFLLLQEKDFDTLSVDEISRTAGVAKKTFYRFYSNRNALLESIILAWSSTFTLYTLPTPQHAAEVAPILEQFFVDLAARALSDRAIALFKFLQSDSANKTHFLTLYRESGIDNAGKLLDSWLIAQRSRGFIIASWPDNGAKHLQALIIAPTLRDIALGLLPVVPELDIRPRVIEVLTLMTPLLGLPR